MNKAMRPTASTTWTCWGRYEQDGEGGHGRHEKELRRLPIVKGEAQDLTGGPAEYQDHAANQQRKLVDLRRNQSGQPCHRVGAKCEQDRDDDLGRLRGQGRQPLD